MTVICDTGPLVAYLNRHDPYHSWAVEVMKQVKPPMLTCEPVLTEALYFLRERRPGLQPGLSVARTLRSSAAGRRRGTLAAHSHVDDPLPAMDLADASIVVMSESHPRSEVITVDREDFSVYRHNDRQTIDFLAHPNARQKSDPKLVSAKWLVFGRIRPSCFQMRAPESNGPTSSQQRPSTPHSERFFIS